MKTEQPTQVRIGYITKWYDPLPVSGRRGFHLGGLDYHPPKLHATNNLVSLGLMSLKPIKYSSLLNT